MAKKEIRFEGVFTDITDKGFGVCRHPDGRTAFVADALPEERGTVKVIKEYKSYVIGKLEERKVSSPHRVEPDCAVYRRCGGCIYRHMDYGAELEHKRRAVEEQLKRIGGVEIAVPPPISGDSAEYRNKLLLPVGKVNGQLICGFYAPHSHSIIPCEECRLHSPDFAEITAELLKLLQGKSAYDESTGKGLIRHLYLRKNQKGEFCVTVIVNGKRLPSAEEIAESLMESKPAVKSFYVNLNMTRTNTVTGPDWIHIRGEELLSEELCGKKFLMSPAAFFQVNRAMTEKLYAKAAEFADIQAGETVFDMYCGIGSVGLCVCPDDAYLCGVEIVPAAIENARTNAALNGRGEDTARFFACDAAEGFERCENAFGKKPDTVLLDPPRAGLAPQLVKTLIEEAPKKIVYISCNPATLARDIALFTVGGYKVEKVATVDMFPRTGHVESVVCLSREKADDYIRISVHTKDLQTKAN